MNEPGAAAPLGWRGRLPEGVRPYVEAAPLAAAFLGVSSGFAFAMIAATLTTRLAQYGIRKSAVTAFALTFLAYNFKWLWAPLVDTVRLPVLGRFGQRRSWLWLVGVLVMAAVVFLGSIDPKTGLPMVVTAAMLVGVVRGEPARRRPAPPPAGVVAAVVAYFSPLAEFLQRRGALVVLAFVLIHKIGDTLANLTLRLLFEDLHFTNDEIAFYDVGM